MQKPQPITDSTELSSKAEWTTQEVQEALRAGKGKVDPDQLACQVLIQLKRLLQESPVRQEDRTTLPPLIPCVQQYCGTTMSQKNAPDDAA